MCIWPTKFFRRMAHFWDSFPTRMKVLELLLPNGMIIIGVMGLPLLWLVESHLWQYKAFVASLHIALWYTSQHVIEDVKILLRLNSHEHTTSSCWFGQSIALVGTNAAVQYISAPFSIITNNHTPRGNIENYIYCKSKNWNFDIS